jgi:hypothetical protein
MKVHEKTETSFVGVVAPPWSCVSCFRRQVEDFARGCDFL